MTSTTTSNPSAARTAGAVLGGLATVFALSIAADMVLYALHLFRPVGQPSPAIAWWIATGYRALFTGVGGWVAARLMPARRMGAVWILTGIGTLLGLMGIVLSRLQPGMGPAEYAWAVALTGPLCSWLGGRVATRNDPEASR